MLRRVVCRCRICPGTNQHGYSLAEAKWDGNESRTGLDYFCKECPPPASAIKCLGGTDVVVGGTGW